MSLPDPRAIAAAAARAKPSADKENRNKNNKNDDYEDSDDDFDLDAIAEGEAAVPPPTGRLRRAGSRQIKSMALAEMREIERGEAAMRSASRRASRRASGDLHFGSRGPGGRRRRRWSSPPETDDGDNASVSLDIHEPFPMWKKRKERNFWEVMAVRASTSDMPPNELVKRGAFFLMSSLTCVCGLIWTAMYIALNERLAAIFPSVYSILMTGCLLLCTVEGRYGDIVNFQLFLILILPLSLQLSVGGMVNSGGVMIWSFLCPLGGALFCTPAEALQWFGIYVAMSVSVVLHEAFLGSGLLTSVEIFYFIMNFIGSMTIVFFGAYFFSSQLENEYARSEDLLLNILPPSIAKRLKEGECHIVDNFDGVTILFADLVGFTKASSEMHPNFLVGMFLRDVFSAWDELCQWRKLEKIKTIGDAFMVVGGLSKEEKEGGRTHAEEVMLLALEFQDALEEVNAKYGLDFQVRIGIHTGPVIAGVIGLKKFAFDVWGDAVNTASRMESHGFPGKIHVSEATYEAARHINYLEFECLGESHIKGKGPMITYMMKEKDMEKDPHCLL